VPKVPVPDVVKVTVPKGVEGVAEVSVTVAVHVTELPTTTGDVPQFTVVDVGFVTLPYVPPTSGTPVILAPATSKSELRPPLPFSVVASGKLIFVPGPATAL